MPNVLIVGNSGAARECYWILRDVLESAPGLADYYTFGGFFDWQGYVGDLKELQHLYLGNVDAYTIQPEDMFVIGIAKPELRAKIFSTLKGRGANFMNLVHPWTSISRTARIGEGNVFQRGSTIFCNTVIGDGNYINGAANISHDAQIGDFNFLAPYSIVLGGACIGSLNHLGPHSVVLEHSVVGNSNILAPGSTIYKGCKDNCRMAGNPALKIGDYPASGTSEELMSR